jgi:magnesium and cobalt exporter, CNNM family
MIWLAVAFCMLVSFAFAGIEAGILSVNRVRLRHQAKLGDQAAVKLERLLSHPERLLLTVLLVTNFMNVCAVILSTQEIVRLAGLRGYAIALVVMLPLYLLGFELLPKSLFRRFPYRALAALSELLRVTEWLLSPVVEIAAFVGRLTLRKERTRKRLFAAREEFKHFTIESEQRGALSKTEREMIHSVVDFRGVTAKDVMAPIAQAPTIRADAPIDEMLALSRKTHRDRLCVVSEGDMITGMVNAFEVLLELPVPPGDGGPPLREKIGPHQRRIITVAASDPAYGVIRKMRAVRTHLAVVADDAGKQLGIVTSEDLVKRLVSAAGGKTKAEAMSDSRPT